MCVSGATTFSIMTLSIKGLYVALIINKTQHNNALNYAECWVLFIVMLRVLFMQSVLMLNVIMISVVAPCFSGQLIRTTNLVQTLHFRSVDPGGKPVPVPSSARHQGTILLNFYDLGPES